MISQQRREKRSERLHIYGHSKTEAYEQLITAGYYLPPITSPVITCEYLRAVRQGTCVGCQTRVREYMWLDLSNNAAYCLLSECTNISLGFDILMTPPKQWMINMAYTLRPRHPLFISISDIARISSMPVYADRGEALALLLRQVPNRQQLEIKYKDDMVSHLQDAACIRLEIIDKNYEYCTVDLNNPLLV